MSILKTEQKSRRSGKAGRVVVLLGVWLSTAPAFAAQPVVPQPLADPPSPSVAAMKGRKVAYFSLEMSSSPGSGREGNDIPGQRTGGLGVIADDLTWGAGREITKAGGEFVGVSLLYGKPWAQRINERGEQWFENKTLDLNGLVQKGVLKKLPFEFDVVLAAGHKQHVQVFEEQKGKAKVLRLYAPGVTDQLYTGGDRVRMNQELLLSRGGLEALAQYGFKPDLLHLNESHCGFVATDARFYDQRYAKTPIVSTTHTPVAAGLQTFPADWFGHLGYAPNVQGEVLKRLSRNGVLDLTQGMFSESEVVNTVSKEHLDVMKGMFPDFAHRMVDVTNGVEWEHDAMKQLTAKVKAQKLTGKALQKELWNTKQKMKNELIDEVAKRTGTRLDPNKPILGFMRRATPYKRTYTMIKDEVYRMCRDRKDGGLGAQVVVAAVAHPADNAGQVWIKEFNRLANDPALKGRFVFVPGYLDENSDLALDKLGVAGADFWMSSPEKKLEACGTSDRRAVKQLGINIATEHTAGWQEYIRPINPKTREGNGLYIDGDTPAGLYKQMKLLCGLYYNAAHTIQKQGIERALDKKLPYLAVLENVYRTIPRVSIEPNVLRQVALTYLPALKAQRIKAGGVTMSVAGAPRETISLRQPGVKVKTSVELDPNRPDGTPLTADELAAAAQGLQAEIWAGQPGQEPWAATPMKLRGINGTTALYEGVLNPTTAGTWGYKSRVAPRAGVSNKPGVNFRWSPGEDNHVAVTSEGIAPEKAQRLTLARLLSQNPKMLPGLRPREIAGLVAASGGDLTQVAALLATTSPKARQGAKPAELLRALDGQPSPLKVFDFSERAKGRLEVRPGEPLLVRDGRNATPFTVRLSREGYGQYTEVKSAPVGPKGEQVAVVRPAAGLNQMAFEWHTADGNRPEGRTYPLQVNGPSFRPQMRRAALVPLSRGIAASKPR